MEEMVPIVRLFKREKTWYIDYTVNGKRKREPVSKDKKRAQLIAATKQSNLDKEKYGLPLDTVEASIQDLISSFINSKRNRVRTATMNRYQEYLDHFVKFMSDSFPSKSLIHEVKSIHIDECLQSFLDNGGAPKTANEELALLKQLFRYAKNNNHILVNPTDTIRKFQVEPATAVAFYSEQEMNLILENSPQPWRDIYEFLYLTGLRNGELINLTWDNVDLENEQITIQSGGSWETKTNKFRIVPLNKRAIEILKHLPRSSNHDYAFTDQKSQKISEGQPYKKLKRVLGQLDLEGNIHKIRHTFASHLVMKGEPLYNVSKLLGHTSIDMTQKYAHLAPESLRKTVDKL